MPRAGFAEWDDHDAFDEIDERPSRRARKKPLPWLRMLLLSGLSVAVLAYFANRDDRLSQPVVRGNVPPSVLIAPAPVWKPIAPAPAVYVLEKASGPVTMEARQHTSGAREDTLIVGRFGEPRHARITLTQGSAEPARSFFVDVVRRAADAGLSVARNGQSRMVMTKFGPVEAAPVTFAGAMEQTCQAFRYADAESNFSAQGWLCDAETRSDDTSLACFIDGIALAGATNPSLKVVFAQADRNRLDMCGGPPRTAPISIKTPRRP